MNDISHSDLWPLPGGLSEHNAMHWRQRNWSALIDVQGHSAEDFFLAAISRLQLGQRDACILQLRALSGDEDIWSISALVELALLVGPQKAGRAELLERVQQAVSGESAVLAARRQHALGLLHLHEHRFDLALSELTASETAFRQIANLAGHGQVCDSLSAALSLLGHAEAALSAATRSLACKTLVSDLRGVAIALGTLGRLALLAGRFAEAVWYFNQNVEIKLPSPHRIAGTIWLARAYRELGEHECAIALAEITLASPEMPADASDWIAFLQITVALSLCKLNRNAEAVCALKTIAQALLKPHTRLWLAYANIEAGIVPPDAVEALCTEARDQGIAEVEVLTRIYAAGVADCFGAAQEHRLIAHRLSAMHGFTGLRELVESQLIAARSPALVDAEVRQPINDSGSGLPSNYLIRERLGGGAFGYVLRAYDLRRQQEVAIKVMNIPKLLDTRAIQRALDSAKLEFEAAQRLRHSGIARIYALGQTLTGQPYVIQEFISGKPLREMLPWTRSRIEALRLLAILSHTIDALHLAGVVHLDLKPDNVIVRYDGTPTLIDFGIAALLGTSEQSTQRFKGTAGYAPPEQLEGLPPSPSMDIYALAVLAHELLTDSLPKAEQLGTLQTLLQHAGMAIQDAENRVSEKISGPVRAVIVAALSSKAHARPRDARVMASTFERAI